MSLDYPPAELRVLLKQAAEIAAELYDDVDTRPPFHTRSPSAVRRAFDEPLPRHKADMEQLLKRYYIGSSTNLLNTKGRWSTARKARGRRKLPKLVQPDLPRQKNQRVGRIHLGRVDPRLDGGGAPQ